MKKAFDEKTANYLGYQKYHVGGLEFLGYFLLAFGFSSLIIGIAALVITS